MTIDSLNTFHGMGTIATVTSGLKNAHAVKRASYINVKGNITTHIFASNVD